MHKSLTNSHKPHSIALHCTALTHRTAWCNALSKWRIYRRAIHYNRWLANVHLLSKVLALPVTEGDLFGDSKGRWDTCRLTALLAPKPLIKVGWGQQTCNLFFIVISLPFHLPVLTIVVIFGALRCILLSFTCIYFPVSKLSQPLTQSHLTHGVLHNSPLVVYNSLNLSIPDTYY